MNKVLRVGEFGLKIVMLQVVPGHEGDVVSDFRTKLSGVSGDFRIFKALGHYDLLVFYHSRDFSPDLLNKGSIRYILKSNEILAFPWNIEPESGRPNGRGFDFKKLDKKLVGLSFLKINPSVFRQTGTAVEESFVRYGVDQSNITILGSFGWNETVLLVHENTFSAVYRTLANVSNLQVSYDEEKPMDTFLLKTLSFLGVNYSLLDLPNGGRVARAIHEKINANELFPRLYVTCCPQYMKQVIEDGSTCFGPPAVLLGTDDISFEITKPRTWGKCIAEVIRFRSRNRESIFSTALQVKHVEEIPHRQKRETCATTCKRTSMHEAMDITEEEIRQITEKRGDPLKDLLANTLYTFNSLVHNEIVRDSFSDMIKFARETKRMSLDESFKSDTIASFVDRIIFGAQQRAYSTFSSIDDTEYRFSPFKGGIQRILQAIELLPCSMLRRFGMEWKGFVNAGEAASFKADLLVLNMPTEYLFQPQEWWGLFHEIGHIYTLVEKEVLDSNNPTIKDFMQRVVAVKRGEPEWLDLLGFSWEVAADIFDYQFGFNCDYETYRRVTWQYLKKYMASRPAPQSEQVTYIFRSLCTSLYDWLRRTQEGKPEAITQELVRPKIEDLLGFLRKDIGISTSIPNELMSSKVIPSILRFRPLLTHLLEHFERFRQIVTTQSEYLRSAELAQAIATISKGQIYWGDIDYPEVVIYTLKKDKIMDFKAKIALILTFWHSYVRRFAPDLEKAEDGSESPTV